MQHIPLTHPAMPGMKLAPAEGELYDPYQPHPDDEAWFARQERAVAEQLDQHPPSDPALRARLERQRVAWGRMKRAAALSHHFATGEGDRKLF